MVLSSRRPPRAGACGKLDARARAHRADRAGAAPRRAPRQCAPARYGARLSLRSTRSPHAAGAHPRCASGARVSAARLCHRGLRGARPARLRRRRRCCSRRASAELIPTGLAIHLDDPGLAAVILPRSGLGHQARHRARQSRRTDRLGLPGAADGVVLEPRRASPSPSARRAHRAARRRAGRAGAAGDGEEFTAGARRRRSAFRRIAGTRASRAAATARRPWLRGGASARGSGQDRISSRTLDTAWNWAAARLPRPLAASALLCPRNSFAVRTRFSARSSGMRRASARACTAGRSGRAPAGSSAASAGSPHTARPPRAGLSADRGARPATPRCPSPRCRWRPGRHRAASAS